MSSKEKAEKRRKRVIDQKWCHICGGTLEYLGGTVGGAQLYGCDTCLLVYQIPVK